MTSYIKMLDQRLWKMDLENYWRWKTFLDKHPSMSTEHREWVLEKMKKIQERWPNHKME